MSATSVRASILRFGWRSTAGRGFVGRRGCRGRVTRGVLGASSYITRVSYAPPPTRPLKYHVLRLLSVNQGAPADSRSDNSLQHEKVRHFRHPPTNPERVTHDSYPYTLPRCAGHGAHLIGGCITAYRSGISRIIKYHAASNHAGQGEQCI